MQSWVAGSAVGVFLLAILSDCIFRNRLFFTPIAACLLLEIGIEIGLLIALCIDPGTSRHSSYILFTQGFVESSMQFYLFFLTPIKIATKYRATQEVTPAATVIATVMSVQYLFGKLIRSGIHARLVGRDTPFLDEIIPLFLYLIAIPFIYRSLRKEISEQQASQSQKANDSLPM